jgi:hypothetical protein
MSSQHAAEDIQDLTSLGSISGDDSSSDGRLVEEPFNKEKVQENIRGRIALTLVFTFVGFVGLVVLIVTGVQIACVLRASCAKPEYDLTPVKTIVELILTPLVGLVGTVSGFYFGEKSTRSGAPG